MPAEMERKLRAEGKKKGLTGDRLEAYIFGIMTKLGWRKGKK